MTNPYTPPYEEGKGITEQPMRVLMDRLEFQTDTMGTILQMTELPEYQEVLRRGVRILPDIWSDRENFSHWQNVLVQTIAQDIGETIEFPEEARTKVKPAFAIVLAWLERKVRTMQASN